ncbi:hypothetical protein PRIC1_011690 [Phytophthora ramorum]
MDATLKPRKPGVDIEIPVQVFYVESDGSERDAIKNLLNIGKAEKVIQKKWGSLQDEVVKARSLRCTFVLNPMIVDFDYGSLNAKIVNAMETLMVDNVCFAQL